MISVHRIQTVVLRYFYATRRDFGRLLDFTYWPTVDIFLFGFLGVSLDTGNATLVTSFMAGLVLWQIAHRTSLEISRNFAQELWDRNIINMLATPLTLLEWLLALMILGILGSIFALLYGGFVVKFLLGKNIFLLGWPFMIFVLLLIMSGWVLGMIASSFLVSWGQRLETMVWAIAWLPAPFCGVYYPVNVLPSWAQVFSNVLPMTYAFAGVREYIATGLLRWDLLIMSLLLNIVYFMAVLCFFMVLFRRTKNRGFASLG